MSMITTTQCGRRCGGSLPSFALLVALLAVSGAAGAGQPPQETFTLYRSFPDVAIPDQDGVVFRFRDHVDKLVVLHFCTSWCSPCQNWSSESALLQADLQAAIGAEHFLLVDALVENVSGGPSNQALAEAWKTTFGFPGPVLHAEGSTASPLYQLWLELNNYYQAAAQAIYIPYFVLLAPGCDNQIVVRASGVTPPQLAEELRIASRADMVAVAAEVWAHLDCREPIQHRLDRCATFGQPSTYDVLTGDVIDSAVAFSIPAGTTWEIGAVTAVQLTPEATSSATTADVRIFADTGGLPGGELCVRPDVTAVGGSPGRYDRTLQFPVEPSCLLGGGSYWLSVRPRTEIGQAEWLWQGGVLADEPDPAFRDPSDHFATGCLDWTSGGACFGSAPELCYLIEAPIALFTDGFETGDVARWSIDPGATKTAHLGPARRHAHRP
jgi:hypothetical protein